MSAQPRIQYNHTVGFFAGPGHRGFNHPVDVGIGRDGLMYVLNRAEMQRLSSKRVTMCTVGEGYLGQFGAGGSKDGQMIWPVAIVLDGYGNVYISDEALHRISIFDGKGQFITSWGVQGEGDGQFNGPAGIAFDRNDNLVVVDSVNNRVQRYSKDGSYLGGWGHPGNGDGEFDLPWGVAVDTKGSVYVADWRNDRVQKFDSGGRHRATWGTEGSGKRQLNRPSGLAVDDEGYIYVADWGNERVQVLTPEGDVVATLRGEAGMSTWADEFLEGNPHYKKERLNAVQDPHPDGSDYPTIKDEVAANESLFWGPTSVKLDGQGRIFVVDSCRHRVQVYCKKHQVETVSVAAAGIS